MFDIVGKRYVYFALSSLFILLGIAAMLYSLATVGTIWRLSIDFTGGSLLEARFDKVVQPAEVRQVFVDAGFGDTQVQTDSTGRTALIRAKALEPEQKTALMAALRDKLGNFEELRYESVGPTIGAEVTRTAAIATVAAALIILLFIIFAFRRVPNAFRYGVCAIIAMIHDLLVVSGFFALMGVLRGWEVDSLFLTAILTVTGFSVQDTIVVFDRIRENVPKRRGEPFEVVVNRSLLETLHRSLVTQLNAIFVLVAVAFFGGVTMRQFALVLLVGMLTGTYSSIFNAVPLLVVWEKGEIGAFFRRLFGRQQAVA
jgi:preprotein translocase subunit SecF